MQDNYKEVLIVLVAGTILFLVLTGIVVYILFFYWKKKSQHDKQLLQVQKQFTEELLLSKLEIQEHTFNHISQEIHDNVGQILSLAKVQINIMNESEEMNRDLLNEVKQNIGKALADLRDIAKSLNSERIRAMSVHAAVLNETERINKSGIIDVHVLVEGEEKKMDDQKKLILFRVIQESLQNIIKHADASQVYIVFTYMPGVLQTTVKDNGKGFDQEEAIKKNAGIGLSNIKTRASLTGGTSAIQSIPGEGTTITINMPYE